MRAVVFSFILLTCAACGNAHGEKTAQISNSSKHNNDVINEGLKGAVKTVTTTRYSFEGSTQKLVGIAQIEFDRNGYKKIENHIDLEHADSGSAVYVYDSTGRLAEEQDYDGMHLLWGREDMIYGKATACTSTNVYRDGKLVAHRYLHYDSAGNLAGDSTVNITIGLIATSNYTYDGNNRKLTERKCNYVMHHTANIEISYHYNSAGFPDLITDSMNGSLRSKITVSCEDIDAYGNWRTSKKYSEGKPYAIEKRKITYW